jgi:hypothetical protein
VGLRTASKLNTPSTVDRRKWRRYEVNWPFSIEGIDKNGQAFWANGSLCDISARGSSGYCFDPPDVGTRVVVSIKVPFKGDKWIRYLADIIRVEQAQSRTLIALKFESTRPVFYSRNGKKTVLKKSKENAAQLRSKSLVTA